MNRLEQQLTFICELDKLKEIIRQTYLLSGARRENTAEHSWQLGLMALILHEHANEPVDVAHVVKLVLAHDIVEIDAGDTFAYDTTGYEDKEAREQAAADRIFGLLPAEQAAEVRGWWDEFEARETAEARFAHAIDRLMPMMQNFYNKGGSWEKHGVVLAQALKRSAAMADGSQTIHNYTVDMLNEAVARGYLAAE